ncbi:MAG TPA: GAF domain-containing protein, partial [Salinarimonas sp.]|nr:GAF domain-containing protein [Salinarimonas sp.]
VMPPIAVTQDALGQLDLTGIEVVCLSYLHARPQVYARYVSRRIKRRAPNVKLLVCFWNEPSLADLDTAKSHMAADGAAVSLEGAIQQIEKWVAHAPADYGEAAPSQQNENERLAAMRELGLTSTRSGRFDEMTREVSKAFGVPIALVSIVGEERRQVAGATGVTGDHAGTGAAYQETSVDAHVTMADEVLVVGDISKDPRFADDPMLLEKGVRFYAGAPLHGADGVVLGTLCVIDTKPRSFSDDERSRLQQFADAIIIKLKAEQVGDGGA